MRKSFLSLLAALTLLTAACDNLNKQEAKTKDEPQEATQDTAVVYRDGQTAGDAATGAVAGAANAVDNAFDLTKAKLNDVKFEEVNLPGISVRGNDDYEVYSLDEEILFDTDKATIKPSAAAAIKQVTGSIGQRFAGKDVRVMGFADSRGDANYNHDLAKQRAEAVKNYLIKTASMDAGKVSTESFGESQPAASNATAAGRKENRRVEIAVRTKA